MQGRGEGSVARAAIRKAGQAVLACPLPASVQAEALGPGRSAGRKERVGTSSWEVTWHLRLGLCGPFVNGWFITSKPGALEHLGGSWLSGWGGLMGRASASGPQPTVHFSLLQEPPPCPFSPSPS